MKRSAPEDHNSLAQGGDDSGSWSSPLCSTFLVRKSPVGHSLPMSLTTRPRLRLRLKSIYASSSLSLGQHRLRGGFHLSNIVSVKVRGRSKFVGCEQCGQCVALSLMTTRQDGHLRANIPFISAGCERLPIRQNKQTKNRIVRNQNINFSGATGLNQFKVTGATCGLQACLSGHLCPRRFISPNIA